MKQIILFFAWILLIAACSDPQGVKPTPPDVVQMVLRVPGADSLEIENGIDAAANPGEELNAIQLMWYEPSSAVNLRQYKIYRSEHESGTVNFDLHAVKEIGQQGAVDTIYIDTQDLAQNVRYYYYVTVLDKDDQESATSDTVSYELLAKPTLLSLNGNSSEITQPVMDFSWKSLETDLFYLRIEEYINENFHPLVYFAKVQNTYDDGWQNYHLEGDWLETIFYNNGNFRWRIDTVGDEDVQQHSYSGSESDWKPFKVIWSTE